MNGYSKLNNYPPNSHCSIMRFNIIYRAVVKRMDIQS